MADLLSNRPLCSNDLMISSEHKKSGDLVAIIQVLKVLSEIPCVICYKVWDLSNLEKNIMIYWNQIHNTTVNFEKPNVKLSNTARYNKMNETTR